MWDDILAQLIKNLSSTFKVHCFLPRTTSTQQGVVQWGEVGGGDRGRIKPRKLDETNLCTKISLLLQLKSYLKPTTSKAEDDENGMKTEQLSNFTGKPNGCCHYRKH